MDTLQRLKPKASPWRKIFRDLEVPGYVVAGFVGLSPARISQILCGHTPCPDNLDVRFRELVGLIKEDKRGA